MGNRDPNKRGLNKNIKNLKRNKRKGCPLTMLVGLMILTVAVTFVGYIISWIT